MAENKKEIEKDTFCNYLKDEIRTNNEYTDGFEDGLQIGSLSKEKDEEDSHQLGLSQGINIGRSQAKREFKKMIDEDIITRLGARANKQYVLGIKDLARYLKQKLGEMK